MSLINKILLNDDVWKHYWSAKNGKENISFPKGFGKTSVVYGSLSEIVHAPELKSLVISFDMETSLKDFYTHLAELFQTPIIEYDPGLVALTMKVPQVI